MAAAAESTVAVPPVTGQRFGPFDWKVMEGCGKLQDYGKESVVAA